MYSPQAEYTEEARAAKREGTCVLSLMVGLDGKPSNVVVIKKLGMGLDQKAVEAVRKWKFEPARQNGRPIFGRLALVWASDAAARWIQRISAPGELGTQATTGIANIIWVPGGPSRTVCRAAVGKSCGITVQCL